MRLYYVILVPFDVIIQASGKRNTAEVSSNTHLVSRHVEPINYKRHVPWRGSSAAPRQGSDPHPMGHAGSSLDPSRATMQRGLIIDEGYVEFPEIAKVGRRFQFTCVR